MRLSRMQSNCPEEQVYRTNLAVLVSECLQLGHARESSAAARGFGLSVDQILAGLRHPRASLQGAN
jgi:hypothetical protein